MDAYDIITFFYPADTPLRRLLLTHSECVRDKALALLQEARQRVSSLPDIDEGLVAEGAMLHDIGILSTHAPSIYCYGEADYILHGTIGARMLRELPDFFASTYPYYARREALARIAERHTGAGLTVDDITRQQLPITPPRDLLPVTPEERLICLADKFFSKSGNPKEEKSMERVCRSVAKFGSDSLARFEALLADFGLSSAVNE